MWKFTDTECQVDTKFVFTWNKLFQEFHNIEFKVFIQALNVEKAHIRIFPSLGYTGRLPKI